MAKKTALEQQLEELEKLRVKGTVTEAEYTARRAAIMANPMLGSTFAVKEGGSGAKGIFKWGFFGCLGMIGAIIAVIVVIVVLVSVGSSGDDGPSASSTPGQVGTNKGDVHVPFSANSAGEIAPEGNGNKKIRVTILQSADDVKSSNQFEKPATGKKFYGVEVVVQNVGSAEATTPMWKLRDSHDGEYEPTFFVGSSGTLLDTLGNLTPGGKKQGWIYFEIAADASPKWLRADPNPFLKNDLYFDVK
jgi:hypothetical protein